ncbi:GFA family protein [Sphingomonas sp. So64.6b]|uniref:GFA family protein n=1 Tax=Sphingomonas sp. So64.6b TaxID=2997354 RepID=UPI0016006DF1|nr:GFA family protein [Sphingomonas sp. So64.6b]QNA85187.1 GFA family protein [Sphingomonas sp. So64.6b]
MAFEGSCQCGAVNFSVDADAPDTAMSCNCSHCRRKGMLLSFFPASSFTLESGEDDLVSYTFNTHKIDHRFCATCGTQAFAYGVGPDGVETRAINLRCVPSIDLDALTIQKVDGASR